MKQDATSVASLDRPWPLIMFVAGENSGDLHASRVITELKTQFPNGEYFGFGGDRMERAGMRLEENLAQKLPIMGFTQVAKNYPKIRKLLQRAAAMLTDQRPDLLVLVDYPGFNLRTAVVARRLGIPVVYYISPQVWAWHKDRIKIIRANIDKMLVILPFEADFYRKEGVDVEYVGHPLQDDLDEISPRDQILARLGFEPDAEVIGLIPGSRNSEVIRHLTVMLEAARIIKASRPKACFVVPRAGTVPVELLHKYLDRFPDVTVTVVGEDHKSLRAAMDFAICKSGTSTLEFALLGVPLIIIYKASFLTAFIGMRVLKIPYIGLVNIVAGEEVAVELLQDKASGPRIAGNVIDLLDNPDAMARMKTKLDSVAQKIGGPGASTRAAAAIAKVLYSNKPQTKEILPN